MVSETMKTNFFSRMMRKLFVRTFISYVGLIALVFLLIYLFSQNTIKHFYTETLNDQLRQVGHALKPKAVDLFEKNDMEGMDRLVKRWKSGSP